MEFAFDIFAGIPDAESGGLDRPDESAGSEEQESLAGQPQVREFIPRTPASAKRNPGGFVRRSQGAVQAKVNRARDGAPSTAPSDTSEPPPTDLGGVDTTVRETLNGLGYYFFRQIPTHVEITYGELLSRQGAEDAVGRLEDISPSSEDSFQEPLGSQPALGGSTR